MAYKFQAGPFESDGPITGSTTITAVSFHGDGAALQGVTGSAGGGDFSGPGSSTDNAIVRFSGTAGKTGQNSGITIADTSNNLAGAGTISGSGIVYGFGLRIDTSGIIGTAGDTNLLTLANTELKVAGDISGSGELALGAGEGIDIGGATVLNATTLGTLVLASSLTSVGALGGGSIASGFGAIDNGVSNITTGGKILVDVDGTAINAAGALTLGTGADAAVYFDGTDLVLDAPTSAGVALAVNGTVQGEVDADGMNVITGNAYHVNGTSVLNATTLGSAVIASSLTSVGSLTSLDVNGNVDLGNGSDTINIGTNASDTVNLGHNSGDLKAAGMLQLQAGLINNVDYITATTGTASVGSGVVLCSGSAAIEVRLPTITDWGDAGEYGPTVWIKRARGNGTLGMQHDITLTCSAADTIDGDSSITLESANASLLLVGTGSVWNVF